MRTLLMALFLASVVQADGEIPEQPTGYGEILREWGSDAYWCPQPERVEFAYDRQIIVNFGRFETRIHRMTDGQLLARWQRSRDLSSDGIHARRVFECDKTISVFDSDAVHSFAVDFEKVVGPLSGRFGVTSDEIRLRPTGQWDWEKEPLRSPFVIPFQLSSITPLDNDFELAISTNRPVLDASSEERVTIFDLRKGVVSQRFEASSSGPLCLHPARKELWLWSAEQIKVWSRNENGRCELKETIPLKSPTTSGEFNTGVPIPPLLVRHEGRFIIGVFRDRVVRFDRKNRELTELRTLEQTPDLYQDWTDPIWIDENRFAVLEVTAHELQNELRKRRSLRLFHVHNAEQDSKPVQVPIHSHFGTTPDGDLAVIIPGLPVKFRLLTPDRLFPEIILPNTKQRRIRHAGFVGKRSNRLFLLDDREDLTVRDTTTREWLGEVRLEGVTDQIWDRPGSQYFLRSIRATDGKQNPVLKVHLHGKRFPGKPFRRIQTLSPSLLDDDESEVLSRTMTFGVSTSDQMVWRSTEMEMYPGYNLDDRIKVGQWSELDPHYLNWVGFSAYPRFRIDPPFGSLRGLIKQDRWLILDPPTFLPKTRLNNPPRLLLRHTKQPWRFRPLSGGYPRITFFDVNAASDDNRLAAGGVADRGVHEWWPSSSLPLPQHTKSGLVTVWDHTQTASTRMVASILAARPVTKLLFTNENSVIIYGDSNGQLWWWTYTVNHATPTLIGSHRGVIRSLDVTADGTKLLSVGEDYRAILWDLEPVKAAPFKRGPVVAPRPPVNRLAP